MLALTAFSLVLKLVGSQSIERRVRPSTEREKAEGPGVMTREVLGGGQSPIVRSIQLIVCPSRQCQTLQNKEVCILDKGLALPQGPRYSQPPAALYMIWGGWLGRHA